MMLLAAVLMGLTLTACNENKLPFDKLEAFFRENLK